MSKERYVEHTVAWELPNRDSVTKGNYNLADIETKYIPIQTEIISDNKDKTINKLQQRIAELEQQLKNAIVPKFKIGQEVWYIDRYGVQKDIIVSFTYFSIENEILYKMHDEIIDHREKYIFATKEEAQAKLKELGEKK